MSTIRAVANENIWKIDKFLGLNENPDGDTKLKLGEASAIRNWKVTRDRNLKRRPGFHTLIELGTGETNREIKAIWFGNIMGQEMGLAAANGKLWKFYANGGYLANPVELGSLNTDTSVSFFPFSNIVYILNGIEYNYYDGTSFGAVEGYVPLIITSRPPDGSDGTLLEEVNKLTGKRRVWFSPDGTSTTFKLPETGLTSIDAVIDNATGAAYSGSYTKDAAAGTVTFNSAPARGINTIEISYTFPTAYRNDVSNMRYAELYLGQQDNAVFLYGNGTNEAVYSSIDYNGTPRADYFPDLNEMAVADANTPITSMIRHYSQLICYKSTSAYSIQYGMVVDATGLEHWGFYVKPVNKRIGNAAPGQVQLVQNSPFTLFGNDLYEWVNTSRYSTALSIDERQAKRISDRIYATLETFDTENCVCYDDNDSQEYYIWDQGKALVYNYPADAWYTYTSPGGLKVCCMCNIGEDTLCGMEDGTIKILSSRYFNDDGTAFESYWESGSIDFNKPFIRKFMSEVWVAVKPQAASKVTVTIATDKKSEYTERVIDNSLIDFGNINFADFSFYINLKPQIKKLKIKAKKFAFLKFILKSQEPDSSATVLLIDPKIRETGYVK